MSPWSPSFPLQLQRFLWDQHIFLLEKPALSELNFAACQLDETRVWKKNGVQVLEKDQLTELRSCGTDLISIDIDYFHDLSIKMKQSVFKNACKMKFSTELLQFGTEATLSEHFSWNRNSNFSQYRWYWRIGPVSLVCYALINERL